MTGAGAALQAAAVAALAEVEGLNGCYAGRPLQAVFPHALAEADLESDWGHKSGAGREVRLAVTIRDEGERPVRLNALAAAAEAALDGLPPDLPGWRVASFGFLRRRTVQDGKGVWSAVTEYRARMLAAG